MNIDREIKNLTDRIAASQATILEKELLGLYVQQLHEVVKALLVDKGDNE